MLIDISKERLQLILLLTRTDRKLTQFLNHFMDPSAIEERESAVYGLADQVKAALRMSAEEEAKAAKAQQAPQVREAPGPRGVPNLPDELSEVLPFNKPEAAEDAVVAEAAETVPLPKES